MTGLGQFRRFCDGYMMVAVTIFIYIYIDLNK